MKRQWQIQRIVKECPDGQKRWDQAYLLTLEIARLIEQHQVNRKLEENHANSDLRPCFDTTASTSPDD